MPDDAESLPKPLEGVRVVVVDDDDDTLETVAFALEQAGALVKRAGQAEAALSLVSEEPRPHVLVSDIVMPQKDGYWLIRQVRALSPERGGLIPAAALTARTSSLTAAEVVKTGFQVYVEKPVLPTRLLEVVRTLVRK